jgi:tetratricopeptide (TPR) repeat protein
MSDPLRTDSPRALDAASGGDRNAKSEELLLLGLDHYFAGEYEQAVNVWSRALFFDGTHARARAYIERARSALAERQRESEELLQNGLAAFHRGDVEQARRLLRTAIDRGGPADEALVLLDRLDRDVRIDREVRSAGRRDRPRTSQRPAGHGRRSTAWTVSAIAFLLVIAGFGTLIGSGHRLDWRRFLSLTNGPAASAVVPLARDVTLPLPRRGETALARARALAAGGQLRDALTALDAIHPSDPLFPEASRLRADTQRQLLALTSRPARPATPHERPEARVP